MGFTLVLYDVTSFSLTCKFLAPPSSYTCVSFIVFPSTFLPWIIHNSCSHCSGVPAAFHRVHRPPKCKLLLVFVYFLTSFSSSSSSSFCVHANIVVLMLKLALPGFLICCLVYVPKLSKSLKYPLVLCLGHDGASANWEKHFSPNQGP